MRGALARKKKVPAWLKQQDYLNAKLGREELVDRLHVVCEWVSDVDPDVSTSSFDVLAEAVVQPSIMRHKDKEVRLFAACILADLMRVYAPDAPYDDDTFKEICALFAAQLQGLGDTSSQSFAQYFYLLERLAMTRVMVAVLEMDSEDVTLSLFETLFQNVRTDHSSKAKAHMIDIMAILIEESEEVPQCWLELILVHLIEPQKQEEPVAYDLAKALILKASNALTQPVTSLMQDTLVGHKASDSELSGRAHDIILELNRIEPEMLTNILPHLVEELKVDDFETRRRCVKLLLQMFTEPGSSLLDQYEPLFIELLGRYNDSEAGIRSLMVEQSTNILRFHKKRFPAIESELKKRVTDPDDGVRATAVTVLCTAALQYPGSVSDELLEVIAGRILDKKVAVQLAARQNLVKFYREHAAVPGGAKRYKWIPQALLSYYAECSARTEARGSESKVLQLSLLKIFATELIPKGGGREQSKRLMAMYANFSQREQRLFFNMISEQLKFQNYFENLAKARAAVKSSQDPNSSKVEQRIQILSRYFSDPKKAHDLLTTLAGIKNPRVFKLLNELRRADTAHSHLETTEVELRKLLARDVKGTAKDTLEYLLFMLKMDIVGRDKMLAIMSLIATGNKATFNFDVEDDDMDEEDPEQECEYTTETMLEFCERVADELPDAFKGCFTALHSLIMNSKTDAGEDSAIPVHKLFALFEKTGHMFSTQPMTKLRPLVRKMAASARDSAAGEGAVRAIAALGLSETRDGAAANTEAVEMIEETLTDLASNLIESLESAEPGTGPKGKSKGKQSAGIADDEVVTCLSALGTIAETHAIIFSEHVETVQDFVVSRVLGVGKKSARAAQFSTKVKVAGIKVLTAQLIGLQDCEETYEACKPVWKLLTRLVDKQGDVANLHDEPETDEECAALRLQAGCCMLKLLSCRKPDFEKAICGGPGTSKQPDEHAVESLALLTEDHFLHVRAEFADILFKTLQTFKPHHLKYYALFTMISGFSDDKNLSHKANKIFNWGIKTRSDQLLRSNLRPEAKLAHSPEVMLHHLVPLVAHSRSFDAEAERKEPFKGVVAIFKEFFDPLLDRDAVNLGYMMSCLNMIRKCTIDAVLEDSTPLYTVAEIALAVLRTMSGGRHYNITETTTVSLPLYFYAKPDKNGVDSTVHLPSNLKLPTKSGLAASNRKAVVKTPAERSAPTADPEKTKAGGKRSSMGQKNSNTSKKSKSAPAADSDDEDEEDDDELFGKPSRGKKAKGKANSNGSKSKPRAKAMPAVTASITKPTRARLSRAAKSLRPMLSQSDESDYDE